MLYRKTVISLITALWLAALPIAAMAGEGQNTGTGAPKPPGSVYEIEQISGNVQSTRQTGSNNTAAVVQSSVAAGLLLDGANVALITQEGVDNQAAIGQQGSALEAVIGQDGTANAASIDQSGAGLKADIQQFGDGGGVRLFQSGAGNGLPVSVRQY